MAQYEQKLQAVKAAATEERNKMLRAAREEESRLIEVARGEAAEGLAQIRASIEKEFAVAESFLKDQAAALSRQIAEKVLGRSLS